MNYLNILDELFTLSNNSNIEDQNTNNVNNFENRIDNETINEEIDEPSINSEEVHDRSKRKRENMCPGCEPIFQPNQLAHIGSNGCLGDY